MKLKEWEEQFDREQKMKEQLEILKEQRLKQERIKRNEFTNESKYEISREFDVKIENFNIDKTSEH